MKVINAGLDKIEFGFNQNSRDPRFGGYYSLEPYYLSQKEHSIPDEAEMLFGQQDSGPNIFGAVIIRPYDVTNDKLIEGLNRYIMTLERGIVLELKRIAELEQVGVKNIVVSKNHQSLNDKLEKSKIKLEELTNESSSNRNENTGQLGRSINSKSEKVFNPASKGTNQPSL